MTVDNARPGPPAWNQIFRQRRTDADAAGMKVLRPLLWMLAATASCGAGATRAEEHELAELQHICARGGAPACASGGGAGASQCGAALVEPRDFVRVAACAVAAPALILFAPRASNPAPKGEAGDAWVRAAARVREREERLGSVGPAGTPILSLLTLEGVRDTSDLWQRLGLPSSLLHEPMGGALLAVFSTNDHAEGLALLAVPVALNSSHAHRCPAVGDGSRLESVGCAAERLAALLAPTYVPSGIGAHLGQHMRACACKMEPSEAAHQRAGREWLSCIMGAAVAVLAAGAEPPPRVIPAHLLPGFTMHGRVPVHYNDSFRWEQLGVSGRSGSCFEPSRQGRGATHANTLECRQREVGAEHLSELMSRARARETRYYEDTDAYLYAALDALGGNPAEGREPLEGLRVAVIGSVEPWYEAVCLAFGAAVCVTVDYNPARYAHDRLEWMPVGALRQQVLRDKAGFEPFDVALCISSIEHDGLGRYGDPVDPDADLTAMDFLRRVVRPGGRLLLAVPVGGDMVRSHAPCGGDVAICGHACTRARVVGR